MSSRLAAQLASPTKCGDAAGGGGGGAMEPARSATSAGTWELPLSEVNAMGVDAAAATLYLPWYDLVSSTPGSSGGTRPTAGRAGSVAQGTSDAVVLRVGRQGVIR